MSNVVFVLGNKEFAVTLGNKTNDIGSIIIASTFEDVERFISLQGDFYIVAFGNDTHIDTSLFNEDNIIVITDSDRNLNELADLVCNEFGFKTKTEYI